MMHQQVCPIKRLCMAAQRPTYCCSRCHLRLPNLFTRITPPMRAWQCMICLAEYQFTGSVSILILLDLSQINENLKDWSKVKNNDIEITF